MKHFAQLKTAHNFIDAFRHRHETETVFTYTVEQKTLALE